ncbi:MAG: hypothetical protein RMM53_04605, partial [Bacteroidia bacterium]|nr:hypothetical protein [Bacteroidia bacterium]MDW8333478.1 hypothetical protein [Bacteroidia bacterium]
MKPMALTVLLVGCLRLYAQYQELRWQTSIGGSAYDSPHAAVALADGAFVVAGLTRSYDVEGLEKRSGDGDLFLVKVGKNGKPIWKKHFGGRFSEEAYDVALVADGGLIAVGFTDSPGMTNGKQDFFIVRTDKDGNPMWQRIFGGPGNDAAHTVLCLDDGGFLVAGQGGYYEKQLTDLRGGVDFWIVRLDAEGNLLWDKRYGGTGNEYVTACTPTADGGFLFVGSTDSKDGDVEQHFGNTDVLLVKTDSRGRLEWKATLGGNAFDEPFDMVAVRDGYLIVGTTASSQGTIRAEHGESDVFLLKIDKKGRPLWCKSYGGSMDEGADRIRPTSEGNFLIAATSTSRDGMPKAGKGDADAWIFKVDAQGNLLWSHSVGGKETEKFTDALQIAEELYVAVGFTLSTDQDLAQLKKKGGVDFWLYCFENDSIPPKYRYQPRKIRAFIPYYYKPAPIPYIVTLARAMLQAEIVPKLIPVYPLPQPTTIAGRVRDAETGKYVPALVTLINDRRNTLLDSMRTDALEGSYRFELTDTTILSIGALAKGYMYFGQSVHVLPENKHRQQRLDIKLLPIRVGQKVQSYNIFFDPGSARLRDESLPELDRVVEFMNLNSNVKISVNG